MSSDLASQMNQKVSATRNGQASRFSHGSDSHREPSG